MIQRGEDLRFALEACEPIGIDRERLRKNLDRDVAIQLRIARAIDLAHAAGAEGSDILVNAKASAGGQAHGMCGIIQGAWDRP